MALEAHKTRMRASYRTIADLTLAPECERGTFVAPAAFELPRLDILEREVFGPILHVIRYRADRLAEVCDAINRTGYGLTLGLHTRIESTVEEVRSRVRWATSTSIATRGPSPGGEGPSGTGPKAGGPHYLYRFATERVVSVDTTASGGNAALMSWKAMPGARLSNSLPMIFSARLRDLIYMPVVL